MLDPHFRRALSYLRPYWRRLTLVLVLSFCSTGLSLAIPLLSRSLFDDAILGGDGAALRRIVLLFVAITAAGFGLNIWSGLRYTHVSADILFDMRLALYRHLQRLSPRFYARTRFGDIMSRLNTDIGEIQRIAAEVALAWVGNVLFLVGTVGMLAYLDVRLFLLGIALLPVSVWALVHYRRKLEGRVATLRERSADIGSFLIETLQGVKLVVTANAQEREVGRFRQRNDRFIAALMAMQRTTYLSGGLPGVVLSGSTALVFLYGGQRVIDGTLTVGTLVAFMAFQLRLLGPIQALMGLYTSLATVRVSLGRVHEILDVAPEVVEVATPVSLSTARGELALDDVSFSFERGTPVLEHVSLRVAPGECLGIVGPSGSGKSTIADLVLRLLDPQAGTITLDGHDLRTLKLADLRARVALVGGVPRFGGRQHPLRATVGDCRRGRGGGAFGRTGRVRRHTTRWLRHDGGGTRRGVLGRRATTGRGGARAAGRPRGARARRGDGGARPAVRTAGRRGLRDGHGGAHHDPHHAPGVACLAGRPGGGHRWGAGRRRGVAGRADDPRRAVRRAVWIRQEPVVAASTGWP